MSELPRPPEASAAGDLTHVLPTTRSRVRNWLDSALDLVFPPRCVHCARAGALLCADCQAQIRPSSPISGEAGALAGRRATAVFDGPIQSAIHAFKYKGKTRIADLLAERLSAELRISGWQPALITAVPLHEARQQERGYNQSGLLAARLAMMTHLPFQPNVIRRTRDTRPQVGLNGLDRQKNMVAAFAADASIAATQAILIVDDVYTTGATLRACAQALRAAGAVSVWSLTVASAS